MIEGIQGDRLLERLYRIGGLFIRISSEHDIGLFSDKNLSLFKVDKDPAQIPDISFFISSFKQEEIDWHGDLLSGKWHHNIGGPVRSSTLPSAYIKRFEPFMKEVISRDDGSLYLLSEAYFFSSYMKERFAYLSYNSSMLEDPHLKVMTHLAIRQFLGQFDAIMLHASSVVMDGRALLFCGPSGIGKSTVVELLNMPILSDDYVLIRRDGKRFIAYSTPFGKGGWKANPGHAEVRAIYYLKQDEMLLLRRLRHDEALSYSLYSDNNLLHHLCYNVRRFQFSFLSEMFQKLPVYEMRFKKEGIDIKAFYE